MMVVEVKSLTDEQMSKGLRNMQLGDIQEESLLSFATVYDTCPNM